jgi:alkylation response protein AidB-like acyl-CoA dehydrogenase
MLSPTEDQQLVRDSAARLVRDATGRQWPHARDASGPVWSSMTEMGWSALAFAEADGGLGGSMADVCALAVELGRGLMVGSFTVNTILAGRIVAGCPAGEFRSAVLAEIVGGTRVMALADVEPRGPGGFAAVSLRASAAGDSNVRGGSDVNADAGGGGSRGGADRDQAAKGGGSGDRGDGDRGGSWVLNGTKTNIWACAETRRLLVSADAGDDGALLAVVDLDTPGLAVREFATVDAGRALECRFTDVRISSSAVLAPVGPRVNEIRAAAWDFAALVMVAECVGMMKSLIERTAAHLQSRKQFGKPLAGFQVLRHRMADMALLCRRAEVLGDRVATQFDTFDAAERSRLVAAACVKALAGLRFAAEQAIQLHGGMGMSAELPIGRYLRRSIALEATFGSPEQHRARFQEFPA